MNNMKINFMPKTTLGKWSVLLNTFFLIIIATSILLVNVFGVLSYNDHWWDITVPIVFSASIIAFILGIIAIRKNKEQSILFIYQSSSGCFPFFFFFCIVYLLMIN